MRRAFVSQEDIFRSRNEAMMSKYISEVSQERETDFEEQKIDVSFMEEISETSGVVELKIQKNMSLGLQER